MLWPSTGRRASPASLLVFSRDAFQFKAAILKLDLNAFSLPNQRNNQCFPSAFQWLFNVCQMLRRRNLQSFIAFENWMVKQWRLRSYTTIKSLFWKAAFKDSYGRFKWGQMSYNASWICWCLHGLTVHVCTPLTYTVIHRSFSNLNQENIHLELSAPFNQMVFSFHVFPPWLPPSPTCENKHNSPKASREPKFQELVFCSDIILL